MFGDWGAGQGPGLGPHTKSDAKRGGWHWQLRGGGSCLQPKTENRGSFILAPCTMARNLTLSVVRDPPFPASSSNYLSTAFPNAPQNIPAKPWGTRNAHPGGPFQPSQGTYQLWCPKDGGKRMVWVLGHPATVALCPQLSGAASRRLHLSVHSHSFCLFVS